MLNIDWKNAFTSDTFFTVLKFLLTLAALLVIMRIAIKVTKRLTVKKMKMQTAMIVNKVVKYSLLCLIVLYILTSLGIDLSAVLGAAGIAGIAIGFAAQTSFSNIISGFFILTEHSIQIGDLVTIETITGTVQGIDLLSVKILTLDNQMVRVPNETVIKTNLINTTFHPIRRMRLEVGVAYDSDLEQAMRILLECASSEKAVLADPLPSVIIDSFGDSAIKIVLAIWFKKEDFVLVKNAVMCAIHKNFRIHNLMIAFPQIDVHFDSPAIEVLSEKV